MTAILLALLAAAGFGVSDFVGGLASRREHVLRVVLVSYPVGLIGMAVLVPFAPGPFDLRTLGVALLAGLAGGLAILWFYAALAAGPMSVVSPLTAVLVTAIPLGIGMLVGERPNVLALAGAGVAVVAVLLVSREERGPSPGDGLRFTPRVAWLTVGSGVTFALYFALLDFLPADSGLWPLATSRAVAVLTVVLAGAFAGQLRLPGGKVPLRLALLAGVLDVVANVALLAALRAGLLSLVSVITSLYPAATVLLARIVLAERTGWVQRVGLLLAAMSVVLIAGNS